jgi:putative acetyltransferase
MTAIRTEQPGDAAELRRVLEAAFGGTAEVDLVDRLRRDCDIALSLVAVADGNIIGHVAFPRLVLKMSDRRVPVCGLAPLAVQPDRQRQGIGSMLVREGLSRLADRAEALVFVLGDVGYYRRFGFDTDAAAKFQSAYAGPHFQVLRLSPSAPSSGALRYPGAFDDLG